MTHLLRSFKNKRYKKGVKLTEVDILFAVLVYYLYDKFINVLYNDLTMFNKIVMKLCIHHC